MPDNKLHIVSFDVPYPADYGGAIDVYYKIKALAEAGAEIYLHCFAYGRAESKELKKLCKEVYYYPRTTGIKGISLSIPYIINSRRSKQLLERLVAIDAPILFEGVHTTYYLNDPLLKDRKKAVRTHNIEWQYYELLAHKAESMSKRMYFNTEARLLKQYESTLNNADYLFCLSAEDHQYFKGVYPQKTTAFIAPFHPYNEVESLTGMGEYCLYQGNLSHPENKEAALYLFNEVFSQVDMPVIIAGREPAKEIFDACRTNKNCKLITNPSAAEMHRLIQDAHIHVLPTFQSSGMKLKLLYALFSGRHVLVNKQMLHGTGLDAACTIADTDTDFITQIDRLRGLPFTVNDIQQRIALLAKDYSNTQNAERILTYLLR